MSLYDNKHLHMFSSFESVHVILGDTQSLKLWSLSFFDAELYKQTYLA